MEAIKVHKLRYPDKQAALNDLKAKGIVQESADETTPELIYGVGVHAVVEIGLITIDDVVIDGYHYDVMSEQEIEFESKIEVNNPKHTFAGY